MPLFTQQVVGIVHLALSKSLERKSQQQDTRGDQVRQQVQEAGHTAAGPARGALVFEGDPNISPSRGSK